MGSEYSSRAGAGHSRAGQLGAALHPALGLVTLERVESTRLLARRIAEEYGREGLTPPPVDLIAWEQTGGTETERRWPSPAGQGLYLTLVRALGPETGAQLLPFRVAVAACEMFGQLRCQIRWPLDLEVGSRRLGKIRVDILTPPSDVSEAKGDPEGGAEGGAEGDVDRGRPPGEARAVALISFRVNVSADPEALGTRATSLTAEAGHAEAGRWALDVLTRRVVRAVDEVFVHPLPEEQLLLRYEQLTRHRPGDRLRCRVDAEDLRGVFRGFDRRGALRLEVDGEERLLASGGIVDD